MKKNFITILVALLLLLFFNSCSRFISTYDLGYQTVRVSDRLIHYDFKQRVGKRYFYYSKGEIVCVLERGHKAAIKICP